MKLWKAILLTLGIYLVGLTLLVRGHYLIAFSILFGTNLWAAIDSSRIQLKRYRNGSGPVALFFLLSLPSLVGSWLWLAGFAWYLWMRQKILTGTAELKTNDPRCVRCEEIIDPSLEDFPKCGWRQPR
jgi:hypothetical protein